MLAATLLLPAGFAQAAPLPGFDAYSGWGQPLPSLLEFSSLTFAAGEPLSLTAAQGGTTIRVLEALRIERRLNLSGSFSFLAGHINISGSGGVGTTDAATVEFVGDPATSDPDNESGLTVGSGPGPSSGPSSTDPIYGQLGGGINIVYVPVEPDPVGFIVGSLSPAPFEGSFTILDIRPVPLPAALPLLVSGIGLLASRARLKAASDGVTRLGLTSPG